MQAVFRFRGAEEIEVSSGPGGVSVEFKRGMKPNDDGSHYVEQGWREMFTKSQARSLASAIMGAAAEL